jgi:flagellar biosynthesis protein FlhF
MKIVRHIAPDMRQALRSIREQLGEDAVILSSRRIPEGVEVTAAVDFDAASLQGAMGAPAATLTATPLPAQPAAASRTLAASRTPTAPALAQAPAAHAHVASQQAAHAQPVIHAVPGVPYGAQAWGPAGSPAHAQSPAPAYSHAATSHYFPATPTADMLPFAHILGPEEAPTAPPARTYVPASAPTPAIAYAPPAAPSAPPAGGSLAPAGDSLAGRSVAGRSVAVG